MFNDIELEPMPDQRPLLDFASPPSTVLTFITLPLDILEEAFPRFPPDMSPPAFITLAFSPYCHGCGEVLADWVPVDWDLRVRLCYDCSREHVVLFDDANPPRMPSAPPTVRLRDLILTRPPAFECAYLARDFMSMRVHLHTLDKDTKTAFCAARKAVLQDARIHARTCRDWAASVARARKPLDDAIKVERNEIKAERELEIRARLFSLGWDEALTMVPLCRWPLVNKAQPLTEEIWVEIFPELEALLHDARARARAEEDVEEELMNRSVMEEKLQLLMQVADAIEFERKRAKKEMKRLQAKKRRER
ncbi:hypothetical protein C8J57DRAFT_1214543 [Mycena rebaudengoi]|nr:hypothetical protein C8J57DRAFT_1214543 [Mycena rebaudengoi]